MKKSIIVVIGFLLLTYCTPCFCSSDSKEPAGTRNGPIPGNTISIQSSPDLYPLIRKWAFEFQRLNPGLKVEVNNIMEPESKGTINKSQNICFVSNDYYSPFKNENDWRMVVGRDAVVLVMNSKNPFLSEINKRGITPEKLSDLLTSPGNRKWGILLGNGQDFPVNYYMLEDPSIKSTVGNFLNTDQGAIEGKKSENMEQMISEIQKDPYALGFCKMTNVLREDKQGFVDNISLAPIDKNGNGRLDHFEKIYGDLNTFMRGVWLGKYPPSLCRNIYSVSSNKPVNGNEIAFLKWVLSDGQKYLNPNGYFDLVNNERQAKLDLFTDKNIYLSASGEISPLKKALIAFIAIIIAVFIVLMGFRFFRIKKEAKTEHISQIINVFDESSIQIPKGLYFDKTHTWAFMESDGMVRIGIDDFLQHITGPLTRIKMKRQGEKITKGEPLFSIIQNGKQLTMYSPVSGTINSFNEKLTTNSSIINSSPYTDGWIFMITPSNWLREIQFMIMGDKFISWLNSEFSRLKDFFATSTVVNSLNYSHVVLQDGGALKDHILEDFGPEVWEDFQVKFIDSSK